MDDHTFAEPDGVADAALGDLDADATGAVDGERHEARETPAEGAERVEGLTEALVQLGCLESAVRLEAVRMVARLDTLGVWASDGQTSMANWVALRCGTSLRTAREIASVASVIDGLPALAAAFGQGTLSWDQLVPLCRIATTDTDATWAGDGAGYSPEDLNKMVRAQQITDDRARDAHQPRTLTFRPDGPGVGRMNAVLPNDDLEAVRTALDRIREQQATKDPDTGKLPTRAQKRADALASMARRALGADDDVDRSTVVLHTDVDLVTGENPNGHASTPDDTPLAAQTVRRHCCDARVEWARSGLRPECPGNRRSPTATDRHPSRGSTGAEPPCDTTSPTGSPRSGLRPECPGNRRSPTATDRHPSRGSTGAEPPCDTTSPTGSPRSGLRPECPGNRRSPTATDRHPSRGSTGAEPPCDPTSSTKANGPSTTTPTPRSPSPAPPAASSTPNPNDSTPSSNADSRASRPTSGTTISSDR